MTQPQDDIPVAEPVIATIINIDDIINELKRIKKNNDELMPHLKNGIAHAQGGVEALTRVIEHIKECEGPSDFIDDFEEIKEGYEKDVSDTLERKHGIEGEDMLNNHMIKFLQNKYLNNINE